MKRSELAFTLALVPLDYLAVAAAGIAAFYARFHPLFTRWRPVIFDLTVERYAAVVLPVALVWIAVFALSGLYSTRPRRIASELTRVFLACSTAMAAVFALLFFSRSLFESRFIAVAAWVLSVAFVSFGRIAMRTAQRSLLSLGVGARRVVVVGEHKSARALTGFLAARPRLGLSVVARFDRFDADAADRILILHRKRNVDEIFLADPESSREEALDLLSFTDTHQMGFRYTADLFAAAVGRTVVHTFAGIPVIEVRKTPLDGWGAIYKRAFDIAVSAVLIVVAAPVMLAVTAALFAEQPGRVLFSREPNGKKTRRVGQGGKPFHYFKFRSMVRNAHASRFDPEFIRTHGNMREGSPLFKLRDDPRVTPVGRVIRKFHLDELPELFLVFLGRMSLVGPRPHLPEEVAQYQPHQRKVLTVKPGMTGPAQISGRADLDFEEEVRLDTYYIEHWSPWQDLVILLKTPLVALRGKTV
jgi:exopolysaccharide biosynthesis polyprenyl glycosylphosphotransferase